MGTSVKYFRDGMTGAPTFPQGGTINHDFCTFLKTLLVDGFNTTAPTGATYSGGTVTLSFGSDHGYQQHQVIEVSGANEAAYNGEHRVTAVPSSTSLEYEISSDPGGAATGTLSCKAPGAGWTLEDEDATGYRISFTRGAGASAFTIVVIAGDNQGNYALGNEWVAKIIGAEDYVDLDNYTEVASEFIPQGRVKNYAISEDWIFLADDLAFWFCPRMTRYQYIRSAFFYGDIVSVVPSDTTHCLFAGAPSLSNGTTEWDIQNDYPHSAWGQVNAAVYFNPKFVRGPSGTAGQEPYFVFHTTSTAVTSHNAFSYPCPLTGGLIVSPVPYLVGIDSGLRGYLPGFHPIPQSGAHVLDKTIIEDVLSGDPIIIVHGAYHGYEGAGYDTAHAISLGDWR